MGFAALRERVGPAVVGDCLEGERHDPRSGNAEQRTTRGLLVWRKADNYTAFTDGHQTWLHGPDGLAVRPNDERFPWEDDADIASADATVATAPAAAVAPEPGLAITAVETGWGPRADSLRKFPHIRFTITNRSPEALPVYDGRLFYSADFFDPVAGKPFGSGLGVPEQLGIAGLPPASSTSVLVTSSANIDDVAGARFPTRLTVDLYQGNPLTGDRRHVGTYQIAPPAPLSR